MRLLTVILWRVADCVFMLLVVLAGILATLAYGL
jgi:hypothetical protein